MTCKICGVECCKPTEGATVRVFHKDFFTTCGYPSKPMADSDLCWYHQKKADGHFDRSDEYFRFNQGPHEWTPYKSFYPQGDPASQGLVVKGAYGYRSGK
jgi:hypothetical protein